MGRSARWVVGAALLIVSACGQGEVSSADRRPGVQTYTVTATVLESPQSGPRLCSFVLQSLPPRCSGPDIVGWDWGKVKAEFVRGTTWGDYALVGTFDDGRFTLTKPATPAASTTDEPERKTSPCPEPEGGWHPVDKSKATEDAARHADRLARSAEEFAGVWIDQSYLDAYGLEPGDTERIEKLANDPARYVRNYAFTGDLTGREERIREVWGGALCITSAKHTERELRSIQNELSARSDYVSSGTDVKANQVSLTVYVASDELQADLDAKYGQGVVRVYGWLKPLT